VVVVGRKGASVGRHGRRPGEGEEHPLAAEQVVGPASSRRDIRRPGAGPGDRRWDNRRTDYRPS
jgi:hypothetical protein